MIKMLCIELRIDGGNSTIFVFLIIFPVGSITIAINFDSTKMRNKSMASEQELVMP